MQINYTCSRTWNQSCSRVEIFGEQNIPSSERKMSCATCPNINLEECEKVAVEIARQAGKIIKDTCGKVTCVESKQSFADLVTETDQNVEKFVFAGLKKVFPHHRFIGEESVAATNHGKVELTDEPTWIVDPVDG
jgi:3'-phosphoadenosine 5'-phosphosulfate (PAPS) 3'-phosphatase